MILLSTSTVSGLTASEFASKYSDEFSKGEKVHVLVTVRGEPENKDPLKRAKEIRYLQSAVLKFLIFAGAQNVKSDTWNNEFTAEITKSLAQAIEKRSDVVSVKIIKKVGPQGYPIIEGDEQKCTKTEPPIDWSGCNLYGKVFTDVDFRFANLSNANLFGASLGGTDLSGANLENTFLKLANLDGANLTNADLTRASLIDTKIRDAVLTNATLERATLWRADFTGSDLTNVNLSYSILSFAILASTNLENANLDNAGTWSTNLNHCYNHPICD